MESAKINNPHRSLSSGISIIRLSPSLLLPFCRFRCKPSDELGNDTELLFSDRAVLRKSRFKTPADEKDSSESSVKVLVNVLSQYQAVLITSRGEK